MRDFNCTFSFQGLADLKFKFSYTSDYLSKTFLSNNIFECWILNVEYDVCTYHSETYLIKLRLEKIFFTCLKSHLASVKVYYTPFTGKGNLTSKVSDHSIVFLNILLPNKISWRPLYWKLKNSVIKKKILENNTNIIFDSHLSFQKKNLLYTFPIDYITYWSWF